MRTFEKLRRAAAWLKTLGRLARRAPEPPPAAEPPEVPEVPVKLCVSCQTGFRMASWQKLPLVKRSTERTESGELPKTETRTCSQCGAQLTLDFQHYEDFDYRIGAGAQESYARAYGIH